MSVQVNVLKKLSYDTSIATSYDFLVVYREFYSERVGNLALSFLYLFLVSDAVFEFLPSTLALTSIFSSCLFYSETFSHTPQLTKRIATAHNSLLKILERGTKHFDLSVTEVTGMPLLKVRDILNSNTIKLLWEEISFNRKRNLMYQRIMYQT